MSAPIDNTPAAPIDGSQKLLIILSHASILLGFPIVVPLIIYLVTRDDRGIVAAHAAEALNFHLSYCLWGIVCAVLTIIVIGVPLAIALGIASFVLALIGIIKAAQDEFYRYPLTVRFVGN